MRGFSIFGGMGEPLDQTLTIRIAQMGDIAALDALFARAYPRLLAGHYPPSVMVTAVPLLARAQPSLIASGSYYVAQTDEETLVGAGGWTRGRGLAGDVRHVVTDDRMVRQGIGREILTRTIREARMAGLTRLDCRATHAAVPFYEALGFEALGPIDVPLRPGIFFPAILMHCTL